MSGGICQNVLLNRVKNEGRKNVNNVTAGFQYKQAYRSKQVLQTVPFTTRKLYSFGVGY